MGIILHELVGADKNRPFSPHCWKTVMSLAHKGLPFGRNPISFKDIPRLENGYSAKVPIIRDGEKVVADPLKSRSTWRTTIRTGHRCSRARAAAPWPALSRAGRR